MSLIAPDRWMNVFKVSLEKWFVFLFDFIRYDTFNNDNDKTRWQRKHIYLSLYACLNIFSINTPVMENSQVIRNFFFFCSSIIIQFYHLVWQLHYINILRQTHTHQMSSTEKKIYILETNYKVIRHKWSIVKIDDVSKKKEKLFLPINLLLLSMNITKTC